MPKLAIRPSTKSIGHPTSGSGGKKTFNWFLQKWTDRQTDKQTDRQTDISTYRKHWPRGPMLWKSSTYTCNFTKKTFPILEELSCYIKKKNPIYSLPCTKGSETFSKKPGKKTKTVCQTDTLDLNVKDSESCLRTGASKLFSSTNEAVHKGCIKKNETAGNPN